MNHLPNQPDQILGSLSKSEIAKNISKERTSDVLNVVLDAINSSVAGMIITDLTGRIRFANPTFCKMFDYSLLEVEGIKATDLFSTKEVRKFTDIISIIDISKDDTEEFVVQKKDGDSFIVEVSASNVRSVSGKIVGRMASFIDISERKKIEADREKLIRKLQDALDKIKVLKGVLPICASCKKIRDDKGYWNQIERYIKEHSGAEFSHSLCPDCAKKLYPEFFNRQH